MEYLQPSKICVFCLRRNSCRIASPLPSAAWWRNRPSLVVQLPVANAAKIGSAAFPRAGALNIGCRGGAYCGFGDNLIYRFATRAIQPPPIIRRTNPAIEEAKRVEISEALLRTYRIVPRGRMRGDELAWPAVAGGSTGSASYETVPCPQPNIAGFPDLDFPSGVQCGYLTVLENRAKPNGRRVRIFVMRAPAVSATPKRDPVVYLSGGPGGAGSFEVAFMVKNGLNADREVIFVDQRGTHRAEPRVGCPGWEQFGYDSVSLPFAAESTTAADSKAIRECHDRLVAAGVDLAAYNSTENAADIADLDGHWASTAGTSTGSLTDRSSR